MPTNGLQCITLTPTRAAADAINAVGLNRLESNERVYHGLLAGNFSRDELPTDEELHLKAGAHVMLIRNDVERRWSNGTQGTIASLHTDKIVVRIDGRVYEVAREKWSKYQYKYNPETDKLEQV